MLSDEAFARHLREVVVCPPGKSWQEMLTEVRLGELYLTAACAGGSAGALEAFETRFLRRTTEALQRIHPSPSFAEEVQQLLREKLLMGEHPKIADFSGRGPLSTWLRAAAVRTALNHRQSAQREVSVNDEEWGRMPAGSADPELAILRTRFRKEFGEAFEQALLTLTQQERNLLRLHLLEGLSIDKLGVMFQTHRSTVARWIVKSREALVVETKKGLAEKLKISSLELDELMGLVRSQLDVSINRFLRTSKTP